MDLAKEDEIALATALANYGLTGERGNAVRHTFHTICNPETVQELLDELKKAREDRRVILFELRKLWATVDQDSWHPDDVHGMTAGELARSYAERITWILALAGQDKP